MQRLQFCLLLLFIAFRLNSQNLVPNPSFESFVDFDSTKSNNWHKVQKSDTPDYFNLGNDKAYNNIFKDFTGGTKPKSGNGFAGIFCLRIDPNRNIKNIREFIEVPLLSTLEKDSVYKVGVSVCLDNESNQAIRNFGMFFSATSNQLNNDFRLLKVKPQLRFDSCFLDKTDSWIELKGLYKASGTEKVLSLGNFMTDKSTVIKKNIPVLEKGKQKKWGLTKKELAAYYYIDDIIVEKVSVFDSSQTIIQSGEPIVEEPYFDINEIKIDSSVILKNIVFDFDKSDLLPSSFNEIDKLYQLMVLNPEIRVKLEGHTDNVGGYDFNLDLSLKRVESVTVYLINKGIDPERIEFVGYSYSVPLESNETEEGRAINRRVAFKIIKK